MTKRLVRTLAVVAVIAGAGGVAWAQGPTGPTTAPVITSQDDTRQVEILARQVNQAVADLLAANPAATAARIQAAITSTLVASGAAPTVASAAVYVLSSISSSQTVQTAVNAVQTLVMASAPLAQRSDFALQAQNLAIKAQAAAPLYPSSTRVGNSGGPQKVELITRQNTQIVSGLQRPVSADLSGVMTTGYTGSNAVGSRSSIVTPINSLVTLGGQSNGSSGYR